MVSNFFYSIHFFKKFFKLKKKNFTIILILFILIISILYFLYLYIYGEQFYVFRGNHWDLFNYLSMGSLFNNYDFSILTEIDKFPQEYKHFKNIEQIIFYRPLTSLLIAMLY